MYTCLSLQSTSPEDSEGQAAFQDRNWNGGPGWEGNLHFTVTLFVVFFQPCICITYLKKKHGRIAMCFTCSISLNLQNHLTILTIHTAQGGEAIWGKGEGDGRSLDLQGLRFPMFRYSHHGRFPAVEAMSLSRAGKWCSRWALLSLQGAGSTPWKGPCTPEEGNWLFPLQTWKACFPWIKQM